MRQLVGGLMVAGCLLTVTLGRGQTTTPEGADEPEVHRMEIRNGGKTSVRYFTHGLTPEERAVLRQRERLENNPAGGEIVPVLWTTLGRAAGSPRLRRALELADRVGDSK